MSKKLREAAQAALDDLESRCGTNAPERGPNGSITRLRAALAEQDAEPVAWVIESKDGSRFTIDQIDFAQFYIEEPGFKMTFNEILHRVKMLEKDGAIYSYKILSDSEGYKTILILTMDNEEVVFYDERSWL